MRFCDLPDRTFLAIGPSYGGDVPGSRWAVLRCAPGAAAGDVVAWSFTDFLVGALERPAPAFLAPSFTPLARLPLRD